MWHHRFIKETSGGPGATDATLPESSARTSGTMAASVDDIADKAAAGPGATGTTLSSYEAPPNLPRSEDPNDEAKDEVRIAAAANNNEEGGSEKPPTGGQDGGGRIQRSKGKIALIMAALCVCCP